MSTIPNASREEIAVMLRAGHSNSHIVRELRVDKHRVRRIRDEEGLPAFVPAAQTRTIEEKWALFTRPVDGDHLEWTGSRGTSCGTPVLTYKEQLYTAASIAFKIKHGREPHGHVQADCGHKQCVAPDHVEDETGRQAKRQALREAKGWGERPETCAYGHDQTEHGRLEATGRAYCEACKQEWRRDPEAMKAKGAAAREALWKDMDPLLRQGIPQIRIAHQLGVAWETVSKRREQLGLPAPKAGRVVAHGSLEEVFLANTEQVEGGHLRWTGYVSSSGSGCVCYRQDRVTPATLAFTMHHGRPPVGRARPGCGMDGCVAGAHLEDRQIREANRRADTAFDSIFGKSA